MSNEIVLQFCGFKSFFGKIIAWGTEGEVGHASAVLPNGDILDSQHQANLGGKPAGVQIRPAGYIERCGGINILRVTINVTAKQRNAFYDFLISQLGKPYDTKGILGFVVGKDWRDPGAWFCSELQAAALEAAKVFEYPLHVKHNRVTPQELLMLASTRGVVSHLASHDSP